MAQYALAYERLRALIAERDYREGELLPSLNSLVKTLGLGRISIQQAIRRLAAEGVIDTIPRKGCFFRHRPSAVPDADTGASCSRAASASPGLYYGGGCKRIRLGLLGELPWHRAMWEEFVARYTAAHSDVAIQLESVNGLANLREAARHVDILQIPGGLLGDLADGGRLFNPAEIGGLSLDEEAFYPALIEAARWRGTVWGTPLNTAVECQFASVQHRDRLHELGRNGFWSYLDALAEQNRERDGSCLLQGCFLEIPLLWTGCLPARFDERTAFQQEACLRFLTRFEPYFQNSRVFFPYPGRRELAEIVQQELFSGKALALFGTTAWLESMLDGCPFSWGIFPSAVEPGGFRAASSLPLCISAFSLYPMECRDILDDLGRFATQAFFAERGRVVAHREAAERLRIPALDAASHRAILDSLATARTIATNFHTAEFVHNIGYPEMWKWQGGAMDARIFADTLTRRAELFYRAKARQESVEKRPEVAFTRNANASAKAVG